MSHVESLRCLRCGQTYAPHEIEYVCTCRPNSGSDLGTLDVVYDLAAVAAATTPAAIAGDPDRSIARFADLLPIRSRASLPPLPVGNTPLLRAVRLGTALGLRNLYVKDDGRNPSASFKDRASAIAVVKAQERGAPIITTASTGNAAAALSGLCASVAQPNVIFVPEKAPAAKIAQLLAFGSVVMLVKGTYDDAFELCLKASDAYGWYKRNTGFNPYMSEGKKTATLEICEQLGWDAPDRIFVSVGDGCIIGGLHKGLKDLMALGWIDHMPKLMGVQAAGSNYLAEAWEKGEDVLTKPPIDAQTRADSISAGLPRDRLKAMAAVVETGGAFVTVSDEEILTAIPLLARGSGVFGEPAGAAAYAGLLKAVAQGQVAADERVVILNTGSGLKDVPGVMQGVEQVGTQGYRIDANLDALREVVGRLFPAQG